MKIILCGNSTLRKKSDPVYDFSNIKNTFDEMESIISGNYGVGLSGVQVGILKRLVVVDRAYGMSCTPCFIRMVNPKILDEKGSVLDIEGCLSFPSLVLNVKRPKSLKVLYFSEDGIQTEVECNENLSRIVSHEIDHLDGRLFIDRASEVEKLKFLRWHKKIKKIITKKSYRKWTGTLKNKEVNPNLSFIK